MPTPYKINYLKYLTFNTQTRCASLPQNANQ